MGWNTSIQPASHKKTTLREPRWHRWKNTDSNHERNTAWRLELHTSDSRQGANCWL